MRGERLPRYRGGGGGRFGVFSLFIYLFVF